jgi:excisionase family DNA binding protein
MHEIFLDRQTVADALKRIAGDGDDPHVKRAALVLIQQLEREEHYVPGAMNEIVANSDMFHSANDGLAYTGDQAASDVIVLLDNYFSHTIFQVTGVNERLFSTAEAAEYLGMSLDSFKYHVFRAGNITGQMVGNSLYFTKAQLDEFAAKKRGQGRPRNEEA